MTLTTDITLVQTEFSTKSGSTYQILPRGEQGGFFVTVNRTPDHPMGDEAFLAKDYRIIRNQDCLQFYFTGIWDSDRPMPDSITTSRIVSLNQQVITL